MKKLIDWLFNKERPTREQLLEENTKLKKALEGRIQHGCSEHLWLGTGMVRNWIVIDGKLTHFGDMVVKDGRIVE